MEIFLQSGRIADVCKTMSTFVFTTLEMKPNKVQLSYFMFVLLLNITTLACRTNKSLIVNINAGLCVLL